MQTLLRISATVSASLNQNQHKTRNGPQKRFSKRIALKKSELTCSHNSNNQITHKQTSNSTNTMLKQSRKCHAIANSDQPIMPPVPALNLNPHAEQQTLPLPLTSPSVLRTNRCVNVSRTECDAKFDSLTGGQLTNTANSFNQNALQQCHKFIFDPAKIDDRTLTALQTKKF